MDNEKEFIIFCDESLSKGEFYSNFYGGILVGASNYQRISKKLNDKKLELNLYGEIKWSKVTEKYLDKYKEMVKCFFEEVRVGNVKVRIMFTQNAHVPISLTENDREVGYFKLYYQFIKHAFGLMYLEDIEVLRNVRVYFDQFPDTKEKAEQFKGYLLGLSSYKDFRNVNIALKKENITEVRSHEHVLLQYLDIVPGAMSFRLNDRHKEKPPGKTRRGKRTIAKEKLYRDILSEICYIRPNFNIGESTGMDGEKKNRWRHAYRHWKFHSKQSEYRANLTKKKNK